MDVAASQSAKPVDSLLAVMNVGLTNRSNSRAATGAELNR